jgi:hypothetical protein
VARLDSTEGEGDLLFRIEATGRSSPRKEGCDLLFDKEGSVVYPGEGDFKIETGSTRLAAEEDFFKMERGSSTEWVLGFFFPDGFGDKDRCDFCCSF